MAIIVEKQRRQGKYKVRHDAEGKERRTIDGITFDSEKEAGRYFELKLLKAAGGISQLTCQVRFQLRVNDELICSYVADFVYIDLISGQRVVEDVKGKRTREYIIKKRLMKACHNIEVQEV